MPELRPSERDTIGGLENEVGRWDESPLSKLGQRVAALEGDLALLAEVVAGLVKRIENMEDRANVRPGEGE